MYQFAVHFCHVAIPKMTYTVSGRMLNPINSLTHCFVIRYFQ